MLKQNRFGGLLTDWPNATSTMHIILSSGELTSRQLPSNAL